MIRLIVEADAVLRIVPVILDPATPAEHQRAVADFFAHDAPDFAGWCDRLRQEIPGLYPADVVFAADQADFRAKLADADGAIVESLGVGEAELADAPRLAVVQKFGAIAGNIDVGACGRRGVAVEILHRRVNVAVAEQAFALMIALAKRLCELNGLVTESRLRAAGFDLRPFDRRYTGNSNFARVTGLKTLAGATLGIVGMGEIGRDIARRGAAFGMQVLYHQRHRIPLEEERAAAARLATLAEVMEQSDFLSIQLPLTAATRGMIDRAALQRIKPGAILVNVARAELIDRAALIEALETGRLGGFGLDVGYAEPAAPDDPLLAAARGNVMLLPHTAVAHRRNGLEDMAELCFNLWRALKTAPRRRVAGT
jgi:lactate dehydrogenase-like 2-hydroxyacid dehydrogenase